MSSKPFPTLRSKVSTHTALNLHTLTRFIISMDGGSIHGELIKAGIPAKKSAFVQRHGKLDTQHFWYVFKAFNHFCEEKIGEPATFNGYHVFAVDALLWKTVRFSMIFVWLDLKLNDKKIGFSKLKIEKISVSFF